VHQIFLPIIVILRFINQQITYLKPIILLISLSPAIDLFYRFKTDQLDINGLEELLHTTGYWAMFLFILVLAATPSRRIFSYLMILSKEPYGKRLSDWNWIIKCRRLLGVVSYCYAVTHFYIFYYYELDTQFSELVYEIEERPFIAMGLVSLVLLTPLFLTSTDFSMRFLKKNWRRLHRLMYPISLAIAAHYIWLSKSGVYDPYPYVLMIVFLLSFRAMGHFKVIFRRHDDGMESKR